MDIESDEFHSSGRIEIHVGGNIYDGLELATACISEWEDIFDILND